MSSILQDTQYLDKYSRFRYDLKRRETWSETVRRVTDYLFSFDKQGVLSEQERQEIYATILNKEVMPSMRNLAMAGDAATRQNACSYNCAYAPIKDLFFFYEQTIILMSGTGLGYSVETKYTQQLPTVKQQRDYPPVNVQVEDTTEGWADAILAGILHWYAGFDVVYDFSLVRPAGSVLKTKGGRASGHEVLEESLEHIRDIVLSNQGKQLRPIDLHDIACHVAKCIVSGGTRRSAMIAIFDKDDEQMLSCKNSENITGNEQRYLANNSAVFSTYADKQEITDFMNNMFDGNSGEPAIFSRYAVRQTIPKRRKYTEAFGVNPCGEIVLRPYQFCNLSSVICRVDDTLDSLLQKVKIATIVGTLQSMSQHFPNLRKEWEENQEDERLLGVDLNGIMDCPVVQSEPVLQILRQHAIDVNRDYASWFGIKQSTSVTCVKPSGNASVMLNTSAGIHDRFSQYYIRRVQLHKDNPVLKTLQSHGVPTEESNHLPNTFVASFPVKSPNTVVERTALEQLETWKLFKKNWTDHNPSCTVSYKEEEKEDIINWVYHNQDIIAGVSFLPKFDAIYEQMPYEAIDEDTYNELVQEMPKTVNWDMLHLLEENDQTNASQTAGCDGEKCLISF